jgi:hypothetical protein
MVMNLNALIGCLVFASVMLAPLAAAESDLPDVHRVEKDAGKGWRLVTYLDKDSKESGVRTTYDERGGIRSIEQVSGGRRDGINLEYDEHGVLRFRGNYRAGEPEGDFYTFDAQGNVQKFEHREPKAMTKDTTTESR